VRKARCLESRTGGGGERENKKDGRGERQTKKKRRKNLVREGKFADKKKSRPLGREARNETKWTKGGKHFWDGEARAGVGGWGCKEKKKTEELSKRPRRGGGFFKKRKPVRRKRKKKNGG